MRTAGSNRAATSEAIRAASLDLIYKNGFEAASLRELARKVGVQVGSLYNYFKTKDDLLVFIIKTTFEQRLELLESSLEGVRNPREALSAFVRLSVRFHTHNRQETVVGNRELGRLSKPTLKAVVALRDQYDGRLTEIILSGIESGDFDVPDPRIATFAIIGMVSGISNWYRSNGRLGEAELQEIYIGYALKIVGAKPVAKRATATKAAAKPRATKKASAA
jgi:AcrR family transcriptional regulator